MGSHSRGAFSPEACVNFAHFWKRGRRESRVPIAPMGPVQKKHGSRTTGEPETARLSLRDGFTAYFVLLCPQNLAECANGRLSAAARRWI